MSNRKELNTEIANKVASDRLKAEFRAIVEADAKMNPDAYQVDLNMARGDRRAAWPHGGGPKHRYWHKEGPLGEELVNELNEPYSAAARSQVIGSRVVNKWESMGYRRVFGDEVLRIVDRMQAADSARDDERIAELRRLVETEGVKVYLAPQQQPQQPQQSRGK